MHGTGGNFAGVPSMGKTPGNLVPARGGSDELLEFLGEVALVGESCLQGHVHDIGSCGESFSGKIDAEPGLVGWGGHFSVL